MSAKQFKWNARFFFNDRLDCQEAINDFIFETLVAEDLLKVLQELPLGYKTVFNLYAIEGYSHKEIAKKMNVTVSTSKSQFSRAKAMLREKITELEK